MAKLNPIQTGFNMLSRTVVPAISVYLLFDLIGVLFGKDSGLVVANLDRLLLVDPFLSELEIPGEVDTHHIAEVFLIDIASVVDRGFSHCPLAAFH